MILFLEFFILQRFMNNTLEIAMQVHEAGIEFMEAAKRIFPERNGARYPDGSFIGWNIPKFHTIIHKAMDILLFGWSENVSAQGAECAHKVSDIFTLPESNLFHLSLPREIKWIVLRSRKFQGGPKML